MIKQKIGGGWSYHPIKDYYEFLNGEFFITRDIVQKRLLDWGKDKHPQAYIIDVLNSLYREGTGRS